MSKQQAVLVTELESFDIETIPSPYIDDQLDEDFIANICSKGVVVPVIVAKHNDKYVVIDGHRRVRAAYECRKKGVSVAVPVKIIPLDLSNPSDALYARILPFTLNRFAYGRTDEMFRHDYFTIIEDLIVRMVQSGHEFAHLLAKDTIPNEFARLVAQLFGVTETTARKWISKVLHNSNLVQSELAKVMVRTPQEDIKQLPKPTHEQVQQTTTQISNIVVDVGKSYAVEAPKEEKEEAKETKPVQTKPLLEKVEIPDVIFCGHNAVSRDKFSLLVSTEFAPTLRQMCNNGALTPQILDELVNALQDCGVPCLYAVAARYWAVSDTITLKGPQTLPYLLHTLADELRIQFTDMSYISQQFLMDLLILISHMGKTEEFLRVAREIHAHITARRFNEALDTFSKLFSQ